MGDAQVPSPLSGAFEGSFAYKTIRDRMPAILVRVIDDLHKQQRQQLLQNGADGSDSLKDVIGQLSKLRYEMMTNKELRALVVDNDDVVQWNAYIQEETSAHSALPRWFQNPWLFVECYMYRRINEAIQGSVHLCGFDQFAVQKNTSLADSANAVKNLLEFTHGLLIKPLSDSVDMLKAVTAQYLELSLWSNKCDLSISGGADNAQKANPLEQLLGLRRCILINDFEQLVWPLLHALWKSGGAPRIDIVLDNAGFELVTDLALAEVLVALGFARTIYLHVKRMPWFVSDSTLDDVRHTIDQLVESPSLAVHTLGRRWQERVVLKDATLTQTSSVSAGAFVLDNDAFWTLPHDYSRMAAIAPGLHADLATSSLIIFKGDLNYRKLVGDRMWKRDTPFSVALRGFAPAPLLTLRTLKADVVVGLPSSVADGLDLTDKEWMTSGAYGVVQYSPAGQAKPVSAANGTTHQASVDLNGSVNSQRRVSFNT